MKNSKKFFKSIKNYFNDDSRKTKKSDFIVVGFIVFLYSILALSTLGTTKAPQTFYQFYDKDVDAGIMLKGDATTVSKIRIYSGTEVGKYRLFISNDGEDYRDAGLIETSSVFSWSDIKLDKDFKYLRLVSETPNSYIGEVQLYDKYANKLDTVSLNENSKVLLDEGKTVPGLISYKNSMYFDEIYFGRSAYEYAHGLDALDWVHPPVGKLIQAIPIKLFGMSPFTWRLMSCLAGILMIPVMYEFGKVMFKKRKFALLAALLMTFDNFHFAQSRMGTMDSLLVLFIMISSLYMFKYLLLDKYDSIKPKLKYLGLSGLFFGLSCSIKWTGFYLGAGLALAFFIKLLLDVRKDRKLSKQYGKIILLCLVFFIAVPALIYVLSYLLFPNVIPGKINSLDAIINQTKEMYKYHSNLNDTHPFSSSWYSWILMIKPVWYYLGTFGSDLKSVIVGIGNPAIWWFGILSIIYLIVNAFRRRNKENLYILLFIIIMWVPYAFIGRCMFMYHFFPVLPFIMLANVSLIRWFTYKMKNDSMLFVDLIAVILLFIYFYPIASGWIGTEKFIETFRWFSNWIF